MNKKSKVVRYNKWGYIFLLPFIAVFLVFQLIPLVTTIYNSFFLHMEDGLTVVGPTFIGLKNYSTIISNGDLPKYFLNSLEK